MKTRKAPVTHRLRSSLLAGAGKRSFATKCTGRTNSFASRLTGQ